MLRKGDPQQVHAFVGHVSAPEIIAELVDLRGLIDKPLKLVRADQPAGMPETDVLAEVRDLGRQAAVLRPFDRLLGALSPGAQNLVGGEDPHLGLGGLEHRLGEAGGAFIEVRSPKPVLERHAELVDDAEVCRLHAQIGVVEKLQASQRGGQGGRVDRLRGRKAGVAAFVVVLIVVNARSLGWIHDALDGDDHH